MPQIPLLQKRGAAIATHHDLLDALLPILSGNAWKLLHLIARQTIGWGKESDQISYSQFKQLSGIKTNHTVCAAIKELKAYNLIIVIPGERGDDGIFSTASYGISPDLKTTDSTKCKKCTDKVHNKRRVTLLENARLLHGKGREPDALDEPEKYFDYHDRRRPKRK